MRSCPRCRSHSYAYRQHPVYGMVYLCDSCKTEGAVVIQATLLLREVRSLSPTAWYYDGNGGKPVLSQQQLEELES